MALQACRAVLRQAASVLSDCTDAPTAGAVLTSVLDALEGAAAGSASASQGRDALQCLQQSAEPAVRQLSLSIAALAADPRGPDQAWRCACWECGDMLVDVLMPAMEATWWVQLSSELQQRVEALVKRVPAPVLLACVSGFLSTLAASDHGHTHRHTVSLIGGQAAATALATAYIDHLNTTLHQLIQYMTAFACTQPQSDSSIDLTQLSMPPGWAVGEAGNNSFQRSDYRQLVGVSDVASTLLALPDRLAAHSAEFQRSGAAEAFCVRVLDSLLGSAGTSGASPPTHVGGEEAGKRVGCVSVRGTGVVAAGLCAELMQRMCVRGHARAVASVVHAMAVVSQSPAAASATMATATAAVAAATAAGAAATQPAAIAACNTPPTAPTLTPSPILLRHSVIPAILAHLLRHPNIALKLLTALLTTTAEHSDTYKDRQPLWALVRVGRKQHTREARAVAGLLRGALAGAAHTEVWYVLTEQLLTQHTLPTPALCLLIDLLLIITSESHTDTHTKAEPPATQTVGTWVAAIEEYLSRGLVTSSHDPRWNSNSNSKVSRASQADHVGSENTAAGGGGKGGEGLGDRPTFGGVVARVAGMWGDSGAGGGVGAEAQAATARAGRGLPRQGYVTCVLILLMGELTKEEVQRVPGLLTALLSGVSTRIASPQLVVRRQGMRIGRALSDCLGSETPLFDDQGPFTYTHDELWPGALPRTTHPHHTPHSTSAHTTPPTTNTTTHNNPTHQPNGHMANGQAKDPEKAAVYAAARQAAALARERSETGAAESESVRESDSDDESDSLDSFDLSEDKEADEWAKIAPKDLQLRAVAAALRKSSTSEEVTTVLATLKRVELLVRARPDELDGCANEITRALLHCRVPEWAEQDPDTRPDQLPQELRCRALTAVTTVSPIQSGDTLLLEVFSPHLDTYQRLLTLETLGAAATELSNPQRAPQLDYSQGQAPRLVYPTTTHTHSLPAPTPTTPNHTPQSSQGFIQANSAQGQRSKGALAAQRTRVWGPVALDRRKRGALPAHRNTFSDVALRWTYGLLRKVDEVDHGIDLLGRDTVVLASLLHTLGVFAECAATTPAAEGVCSAVVELLAAPQVHGHAEAYVRRAALLCTGQVLAALPPPRVAGALDSGQTDDLHLVKRLKWIETWLSNVSREDSDERCRLMAAHCQQLHQALSVEAAVQSLTQQADTASTAWPQLPGGPKKGALGAGVGGWQGGGAGSVVAGPMGLVRQGVILPHHLHRAS